MKKKYLKNNFKRVDFFFVELKRFSNNFTKQ